MILNYTLKGTMGLYQHHSMRNNETSKVKQYFCSTILYLMEIKTSKTFTLSFICYTWRWCKKGILAYRYTHTHTHTYIHTYIFKRMEKI